MWVSGLHCKQLSTKHIRTGVAKLYLKCQGDILKPHPGSVRGLDKTCHVHEKKKAGDTIADILFFYDHFQVELSDNNKPGKRTLSAFAGGGENCMQNCPSPRPQHGVLYGFIIF